MDYLGPNPPDPFIKVRLRKITKSTVLDSDLKEASVDTCLIELPGEVMVPDVLVSYLLHKTELVEWASRFSRWFKKAAKEESS